MIRVNEQRTKDGYEITFFTDNKPLFRKARILLDKLSSKDRKNENGQENAIAAEVVHCKDCKYYVTNSELIGDVCNRLFTVFPMKPDDFCSYGRKEGKKE